MKRRIWPLFYADQCLTTLATSEIVTQRASSLPQRQSYSTEPFAKKSVSCVISNCQIDDRTELTLAGVCAHYRDRPVRVMVESRATLNESCLKLAPIGQSLASRRPAAIVFTSPSSGRNAS